MPYIKTKDDTDIHYTDWGTGRPVILIHGWPLSGASWEAQALHLAENGFRVIAYDRRGFGKSSHPYSGYDYDTLSADLASLLDTLDLKDASLVGFSMGGGEVARYLGLYGAARVRSAVFVSAVTPYMLKTEDNPEGAEPAIFEGMKEKIRADRPSFLESFFSSFYGRTMVHHTVSEAMLRFSMYLALQASPKATLDCVTAFSATDFRHDLAKIAVPTLFIHGTSDATVPIDVSARRAVKLVPGATLTEYDGEGHGLNVTAAERLSEDLLTFLSH